MRTASNTKVVVAVEVIVVVVMVVMYYNLKPALYLTVTVSFQIQSAGLESPQ